MLSRLASLTGEHLDWNDYRHAIEQQQRVLVRISIDTLGLTRAGWVFCPGAVAYAAQALHV